MKAAACNWQRCWPTPTLDGESDIKIAIVGAGAIGGYLGARLAVSGEDVTFIARNRNLDAIRAGGFRLIEEDGRKRHAPTAEAAQHIAEADPPSRPPAQSPRHRA